MGVRQTVEMVLAEQGIVGEVEVELDTEEVVLGQGLTVEVQPGIDEGEVELFVVVVAVKHVVEIGVE